MNSVSIKTTLNNGADVTVLSDSQLMKHHQSALPMSPEQELGAVYDSAGCPLIFSFSPDGDLYVTCHAEDHQTGWHQTDLTSSVKNFGTPKSFDVCQLPGGALFLTLAIQDINDRKTEHVYIAGPLSNDLSETDFSQLSNAWVKAANPVKGTTVQRIFSSPVDDGAGYGIPAIAVSLNDSNSNDSGIYILQSDVNTGSGAISWKWTDFPTPTSKAGIIGFAPGNIHDMGQGLYILYNGPGNQIFLVFKTFNNAYGKSYVRQFEAPAGAAILQSAPGDGRTTALFAGGKSGLYYFAPSNQALGALPVQIAGGPELSAIDAGGLIVRQDELHPDTICIWALSRTNVYYLHNNYNGNPAAWSDVLLFGKNVARIAPLRNSKKYANELLFIGVDENETRSIGYMWQDPITTIWQKGTIPLHDTGNILEFSCYATHITFEAADQARITGQSFSVTCDSWVNVIINGVHYAIDATTPAVVQTDLTGVITVLTKCDDIDASMLHITGDIFEGTIDFSPNCNAYQTLNAVQSDDDIPFLSAGLPEGVGAGDISGAIKGIMQFHPPAGSPQTQAISFRPAGTPLSQSLVSPLPEGTAFGLSFLPGGTVLHDSKSVQANLKSALESELKAIGGDCIHFLSNLAEEVQSVYFEVQKDGVLQFVANVGERVARFALDHFPKLYKAISWVCSKIKIGLEELIKWLGKVFDWQDIWAVHKVIAAMATGSLDFVVDLATKNIASLEEKVDDIFDDIRQKIKSAVLPDAVAQQNFKTPATIKQSHPSIFAGLCQPDMNWASYQFQHGGAAVLADLQLNSGAPLAQLLNDVVVPVMYTLSDDLKQDFQDLVELCKSSGGALMPNILRLIIDLADTTLDVAQKLFEGLLKLVIDLLNDFKAVVEQSVDMPFISAMYKWVTGVLGESEELTAIKGVSLLVAIPIAAQCKNTPAMSLFTDDTYHFKDAATIKDMLTGKATGQKQLNIRVDNRQSQLAKSNMDAGNVDQRLTSYSIIGGFIASGCNSGTGGVMLRDFLGYLITYNNDRRNTGTELQSPVGNGVADQSGATGKSNMGVSKVNILVFILDIIIDFTTFPIELLSGQDIDELLKDTAFKFRFCGWIGSTLGTLLVDMTNFVPLDYISQTNREKITGALQMITGGVCSGLIIKADSEDADIDLDAYLMDAFSNLAGFGYGLGKLLKAFDAAELALTFLCIGAVFSLTSSGIGMAHADDRLKSCKKMYAINIGG